MTTVFNSGPVNIEQGNSANFVIEYLSSTGELTVPASGDLTISYTDITNASASEVISLTESNSFFTGTWSSTSAALGLATWVVTSEGSTETQATGQIRVLQRQSTY